MRSAHLPDARHAGVVADLPQKFADFGGIWPKSANFRGCFATTPACRMPGPGRDAGEPAPARPISRFGWHNPKNGAVVTIGNYEYPYDANH